jgi:hypothetical protein
MYNIGDLFYIKVKIDESTIIDETLVITYILGDIILTCGHCLPQNAIIPNGKVLFTSGFDNPSESDEIGIILLNKPVVTKNKYYLLKSNNTYNVLSQHKQFFLLNQSKLLPIKPIYTFNLSDLSQLQFNRLNFTNGFFWLHSINKLINPNSSLKDLFDLSKVCIAYSEAKTKSIETEIKTISQIAKTYGLQITTDKIFYLTEPSYSGSPIIEKNKVIGYHLGSTLGFKMNNKMIYWIGKIIYFKLIQIHQPCKNLII